MKMRLLNDRILVKRDEEKFIHEKEEVNKALEESRIVIPEKYQGHLKKVAGSGTIISWGPGCRCHNYYKEGRRVWFSQFAGTRVPGQEKDVILIMEDDLHAIDEDT